LREAIKRAAKGETSCYDVVVRTGENRFVTIDFCLQPRRDETDRIIYLVPSATNITERKRADEQLQVSHHFLKLLNRHTKMTPSAKRVRCGGSKLHKVCGCGDPHV